MAAVTRRGFGADNDRGDVGSGIESSVLSETRQYLSTALGPALLSGPVGLWPTPGRQSGIIPSPDMESKETKRAGTMAGPAHGERLAAQAKPRQQRVVPVNVSVAQVPQLATALTNQHQQTTTSVEVVAVLAQVVGQVLDAIREERNLHFGRTGVTREALEFLDDRGLLLSCLHCTLSQETGRGPAAGVLYRLFHDTCAGPQAHGAGLSRRRPCGYASIAIR